MKIYYKGSLVKSESNDSSIFFLKKTQMNFSTSNYSKHWNYDESTYFQSYLNKYRESSEGITDEKLVRILNKLSSSPLSFNYNTKIIYELVEDTDGNLYAKELHTSLIFPFMTNPKIQYFYDVDGRNNNNLEKIFTYTNENLARHMYSVNQDEVVSINELNEYLNKTSNKKEFQHFLKMIQTFYNENVFNKEIILKDNEPKETQNEIPKIMEDIEYILVLIKKYDTDAYTNLKTKYDNLSMINQNTNNYYEPNKRDFKNLLSYMKLHLIILGENCKGLKDFLEKLNTKYFASAIKKNNDKTINININDVDNFTDMFLKSKDNYTMFEQRDTMYLISLLYLFVVMFSYETIDENKLEDSYFGDNKKTILLLIDTLIEYKLVNVDIQIDFSKEYTSLEVFNIIKKLKFNNFKVEDIKKLVK